MSADTPRVLVVEDERDLADLYATWLSDTYHVRTARDGHEALEKLDSDVSVVLLDRRMPDISGDDILDAIQDRDLDCRVAMVTAVEPEEDIIDMRFDTYLVKPVTRDELERTVSNLLVRDEYDEGIQRLFSLASKKALLEAEKEPSTLEQSEKYQDLLDDIDQLRAELDDKLARIDAADDLTAVYRDLEADDRRD
ncbi:HalX domain-containing protein [Haloplanus halobius]|uniref:HalX domain-containing protein n=1 Tax=Haloplanus halobius TaxID=2934938 RepID=UPI00200F5224|nr:HalX domain-containing protein [Haloplanus sp. XH21]